eukprot:5321383-Prymnesium_polylepis.1
MRLLLTGLAALHHTALASSSTCDPTLGTAACDAGQQCECVATSTHSRVLSLHEERVRLALEAGLAEESSADDEAHRSLFAAWRKRELRRCRKAEQAGTLKRAGPKFLEWYKRRSEEERRRRLESDDEPTRSRSRGRHLLFGAPADTTCTWSCA